MGKIQNLTTFIYRNFNIVQTSVLALILLFLEKIMDMEFVCPVKCSRLAITYSLVFLIIPAAIVFIVACYFSSFDLCCKSEAHNTSAADGDTANGADGHENVPLRAGTEAEIDQNSQGCRDTCLAFINDYKAILLWIILVLTDGRYMECLVRSVSTEDKNGTQSLSDCLKQDFHVVQICQISGLSLILLVMVLYFRCKCISKSTRYKEINADILLSIAEDAVQKKANSKRKEFIDEIVNTDGWIPGQPDALEKLENITTQIKMKVKQKLNNPQNTGGQNS